MPADWPDGVVRPWDGTVKIGEPPSEFLRDFDGTIDGLAKEMRRARERIVEEASRNYLSECAKEFERDFWRQNAVWERLFEGKSDG